MHITAVIPARYASTRLPAKPLRLISGKSLIRRVWEAVCETGLFDKVIIATDHNEIYDQAEGFGADVKMTAVHHHSGTDRIAECTADIETDLIVNVQGDEPFITREPLERLITLFSDENVLVASLMHIIDNHADVNNPNCVKVVVDKWSNAIYFSRSVIPYNIDKASLVSTGGDTKIEYYKHIGVYAYRPAMLKTFVSLQQGILEKVERLEQLRLIENGYKIKMALTNYHGVGIDTPEDLVNAEKIIVSN